MLGLLLPLLAHAQVTLTEGTNLHSDISAAKGLIAFDLLGKIWTVDAVGGQATELPNTVLPARSPKWSPSGQFVLYQVHSADSNQLWLHNTQSQQAQNLSGERDSDQQASWHPDGERVVFSSPGKGSGLDLWELDIATGLRWRITNRAGDEMEAAWSANGRHLVYVSHDKDGWSLVLRRHGMPDQQLLHSRRSIRAPSWRPDGSLITFFRETATSFSLDMVILSDPPLVRQYASAEHDFFLSPVSWVDRHRMIYAADGHILSRNFNSRRALPVRFRANIGNYARQGQLASPDRKLPLVTPPSHKLVIRAARLFDGVSNQYRQQIDVVIDGPVIAAVDSRRDWPDATVLDLGDVTILPGFIDLYSALPEGDIETIGASLLSYGVTTLVNSNPGGTLLHDLWHGEEHPGPRLLSAADITLEGVDHADRFYLAIVPASTPLDNNILKKVQSWQKNGVPVLAENWTVGLGLGVDLLLGANSLPSSPTGRQYQDMQIAISHGTVVLVSGLAGANTPGISGLMNSRQALRLGHDSASLRRMLELPPIAVAQRARVVVGSKPNGLPPGLSLHAELRALAAAGLDGHQVLRSAGSNIGKLLGLEQQIGRVTPGALADLVLVAGDPIETVSDAMNIVAVVRNGRFYSLISLLERANPIPNVE